MREPNDWEENWEINGRGQKLGRLMYVRDIKLMEILFSMREIRRNEDPNSDESYFTGTPTIFKLKFSPGHSAYIHSSKSTHFFTSKR
jgi:hypothetical protein